MKKILVFLFVVLMISSFASAEMIINQQPDKIYNIGDSVTIPVTIKPITDVSAMFSMDLFCGSKQINFYKNGVKLSANYEKVMDASLVLTKELLGEYVGTCKIKAILLNEYVITNDFKISNVLTLKPTIEEKEFEPGQSIIISGGATKENGQDANGFIDLEIVISNSSGKNIIQKGTINNGMYSMNITLPTGIAAGNYLVKLNAYEVDSSDLKTNKGFVNYNIAIKQIPTSLELTFKENEVKPGTSVEVKAILHDQTGEKIDSTAIITIKRGTIEIIGGGGPTEKKTGEYMELPILYNEPPSNWTVFAMSNQLTAEAHFIVIENKEIKAEMMNETLVVTNIGNVPYNGTIIVKIANSSEEKNISLAIDGKKEYKLGAEYEGVYEIEVLDEIGESKLKEEVALPKTRTSSISGYVARDTSQTDRQFFARPLFWIFIIIIFAAAAFILIQKMRKKRFNGGGGIFKKKVKHSKVNVAWESRAMPLSKDSKLETKNKATFSSSIKGSKQDVSVVNVVVKNLGEVQANKGNVEEPLQKIINIAENKKAFVYENQNNLFFIITPTKTRTFKNETIALEIAQDAKEILSNYNRIAKHRLDFGISIEYGSIVEKTEQGAMEFMSLGTLMGNSKKIASASQGEILLGESIRSKLTNVRTEKQENGRVVCYKIKDIKYHDEEHSRFIKSFLKKNEGDFRKTDTNQTANSNTNRSNANSDATSTDPKSLIKGFY